MIYGRMREQTLNFLRHYLWCGNDTKGAGNWEGLIVGALRMGMMGLGMINDAGDDEVGGWGWLEVAINAPWSPVPSSHHQYNSPIPFVC